MKWFSMAIVALLAIGGVWFFYSGSGSFSVTPSADEKKEGYADYVNEELGFSFSYPAPYAASEHADSGATIVLVENPEGPALQIAVSAFDEEITLLTPGRIQQDLPNLSMEEITAVPVGEADALQFTTPENTIETWFIYNGYLYQMSAYQTHAPLLETVVLTWSFL